MARSRPQNDLARLLDTSARPLYAVDEQGRIVFVNRAVAEWAGVPAEELAGQSCRYHSGGDLSPAAAAACGLCPPPVVMTGIETEAEVSLSAAEGPPVRRRVRFIPLRAANQEVLGVIAVAGEALSDDAAPETHSESATSAARLHEGIQRLRHRFRERYYPDRLLGQSPVMDRVRAQIALASSSLASVLIVARWAAAASMWPAPSTAQVLSPRANRWCRWLARWSAASCCDRRWLPSCATVLRGARTRRCC